MILVKLGLKEVDREDKTVHSSFCVERERNMMPLLMCEWVVLFFSPLHLSLLFILLVF